MNDELTYGRIPLTAKILFVFVLFFVGLSLVQYATPALLGTDGYYHIKIGYLIRTQGIKPIFNHLPFTILNEAAYYDHHYLYHIWLSLFAWGDPLVDGGLALTQGAKLASVILPAVAFTSFWWLLKQEQIPFPLVWALLLLAISEPFLYRMSMPRAQSLSLLLLIWAVYFLLRERFRLLAGLGFIYVWGYNAFPLLLVVVGIYMIAVFLLDRRIAWQALVWSAVGITIGLLINPYFPENISFIIDHLAPKLGESATKVGNEWTPYRTQTLVENSGLTFLLFLAGVFALSWQKERIDKRTLFALGMAVLFGYMLFESRRFVEYFPPFVLLFAAFAAAPYLTEWREYLFRRLARWETALVFGMLLVIAWPITQTIQGGRELAGNSKPYDRYAEASLWLYQQGGDGIQIFQTDWDDFTRLFFYNSEATYTAGLDPTFMELHDPELFNLWLEITQGRVEHPGQIIQERFAADYIFSDLKHAPFMRQTEGDPYLKELYRDEYAVIYQVQAP